MAVCKYCGKDMLKVGTCVLVPVKIDGVEYLPVKFGDEHSDWVPDTGRCHDCGVHEGGYHHPGCDVERCPKCGRQLITCDCNQEE